MTAHIVLVAPGDALVVTGAPAVVPEPVADWFAEAGVQLIVSERHLEMFEPPALAPNRLGRRVR